MIISNRFKMEKGMKLVNIYIFIKIHKRQFWIHSLVLSESTSVKASFVQTLLLPLSSFYKGEKQNCQRAGTTL